ncbi:MAG: SDR family NAD(P)-dependent oxidoreductase [bacterium]
MNWSGQAVLVTGAASGIGRSLSQELRDRGAHLALLDVDGETLNTVARSLGGPDEDCLAIEADVTNPTDIESAVEKANAALGGLDVCVANAGVGYTTPAQDLSLSRSKHLLDVNLTGVINTVVPGLNTMLETDSGHVVIVSSVAAFVNFKGGASYCASKAGVLRFAEGLRLDLRERSNFHVTTIHPGWVETDMTAPYKESLRLFEISPREAAENICDAIEQKKRKVIFPWQARLLIGLIKYTPTALTDYVLSKMPNPEQFLKEPLPEESEP